jgi:hypothetical protein
LKTREHVFEGTSKVEDKNEAACQILKETTGIEWMKDNG